MVTFSRYFGSPKKDCFVCWTIRKDSLTAESVEGTSLSLQSIDNVHGCDCLPLGMLSVCNCITDDVLKENLQYTTCFFIDQTRNTFDTTSACKTTDSWLGDTLDVITKYLPVTLSAPLSESFTSFASSRHVYRQSNSVRMMQSRLLCLFIYQEIVRDRAHPLWSVREKLAIVSLPVIGLPLGGTRETTDDLVTFWQISILPRSEFCRFYKNRIVIA